MPHWDAQEMPQSRSIQKKKISGTINDKQTPNVKPSKYEQKKTATEEPPCTGQ